LGLLDDVQNELGIDCFVSTWPVRKDGRLVGVYDRERKKVWLYEQTEDHGQSRPDAALVELDGPELEAVIGADGIAQLGEEVELIEVAGTAADFEAVARGEASPVCFGSALTNFGVDVFLERFLSRAPPPSPRESTEGLIDPAERPFSGFVFKVQANMDPRHRDRVAFLRVCSGEFSEGAEAVVSRTGKTIRLAQPQEFLARERVHSEANAVAGDVVGLLDRGSLRVGDTVAIGGAVEYPGVPRFSPEHFAQIHIEDALRRKHLDRGLRHLAEEGTILLLFAPSITGPVPIVGAVGSLQFDVLLDRLTREYGVTARLERLPFHCARWVTGPDPAIDKVASAYGRRGVEDADGAPLILFDNEWTLQRSIEQEKDLAFHDVQPRKVPTV
jgi:peptide chain release factor 3